MSQLDEADDFYATGRMLAKHIGDSKGKEVSTATLQALIRDFLPQHEEVQEALRSIIARPDSLQLVKLARSGQGGAQKCALIESLKNIYSARTVEAADRLVCGMLGLSIKTAHSDPLVDPRIPDQLIVFSDGEEWGDYIYEDWSDGEEWGDYNYEDWHYGRDSRYRFQDAYIDSELENQSPKSVHKALFLIEGVTALLSVTPVVAGFAITLVMKLMPQIAAGYLMIIYAIVVHWCFSIIGAISSKKRMTIKRWIALSSPQNVFRDISMTYDKGLSFFQFLMLLFTLCWLLVAPSYTFNMLFSSL